MKYWSVGTKSLLSGNFNVSVLDAASIAAALCQRGWKTASSIMYLLNVSELLEAYTRKRTKTILTQSLAIHVDTVWKVTRSGDEFLVPMSSVSVGDNIRVRSGGLIPVDGVVTDGDAMVNESCMTGESVPVHKHMGTSVYAGTVIEEGDLIIQISALAEKSRIQQIIGLIENSENLKASAQSRAEYLADAMVPFSFLGAVLIGAITRNFAKALAVLMVDYSCAVKLSTPIAVISAMREASVRRIMVKGGKFLESFAQADTIIFDKTGTLTTACPRVEEVLDFVGCGESEILRIAACIEEHFPHSMARAVTRAARERGLAHEEKHAEVEYVVAHGVATSLDGKRALIGSYHFVFEDEKVSFSKEQNEQIEKTAQGRSVLYLAIGDVLAGALFIQDPPRKEAGEVISELKKLGIKKVVMLTGDQESCAKAICERVGIDEYCAQALPEDKAIFVEDYRSKGHKVIMVGDGINDSPALAAADVSVAMKDASDLARETADVTLLTSDLRSLVELRKLSQRMLKRINKNYGFILGFNSALLVAGIFGVVKPTTTAFLHNLSTMAISAKSMRPYLKRDERSF